MNKEHNFVSAVVFVGNDCDRAKQFLDTLNSQLNNHFFKYEIIIVNENSAKNDLKNIKSWASEIPFPVTIINMTLNQPHEQCMNAGLDLAIGDYVYEFDSTEMPYNADLIWQAYEAAMEGNDIVNISPSDISLFNKIFYKIFNSHNNAKYSVNTNIFSLVSRRAINRAHAINSNMPYRKATYANCGLKIKTILFEGKYISNQKNRTDKAVSSLVLYTNFGYKFSLRLSLVMLIITVFELIYTLFIWFFGNPISGWTTTMIALTVGFTGLFAVLTIVLKYLSLILDLLFRKQSYYVEGIEKF